MQIIVKNWRNRFNFEKQDNYQTGLKCFTYDYDTKWGMLWIIL